MEEISYLRFVLVLLFLIGLILLTGALVRKYGPGGLTNVLARGPGGRGRQRRLKIVESAVIGPKHRLVLVARDGVEHLLVLGADGAVVVERGIEPPRFTLPDVSEAPDTALPDHSPSGTGQNAPNQP